MGSKGGFLKGAVLGALAGITAGVLFAPKSGKETREDIKNKAVELKANAEKMYADAAAAVERKVAEFKKVGKQLSLDSYESIINEVVDAMKSDDSVSKEAAKKLKAQLRDDYKKVIGAVKA